MFFILFNDDLLTETFV